MRCHTYLQGESLSAFREALNYSASCFACSPKGILHKHLKEKIGKLFGSAGSTLSRAPVAAAQLRAPTLQGATCHVPGDCVCGKGL